MCGEGCVQQTGMGKYVCIWLCRECGVCEEGVWDRCEGVRVRCVGSVGKVCGKVCGEAGKVCGECG